MDIGAFMTAALEMNQNIVTMALNGLTAEELNKQPSKDTNSIGFLGWHAARAEDAIVSTVSGQPQVWMKDGWHSKFGMPADPRNTGSGYTPEQVTAFKADLATLQGYTAAVRNRTKEYLKAMPTGDLEKQIPSPRGGTMAGGQYLAILLMDHLQHGGQIAYLRGLHRGKGWLPF